MRCIWKGGENPPFTLADFLKRSPQFETILPEEIIQMYLDFAHHCIKYSRWRNGFEIGIGLLVAHFCTLYLQSFSDSSAQAVINAGQACNKQNSRWCFSKLRLCNSIARFIRMGRLDNDHLWYTISNACKAIWQRYVCSAIKLTK